MHINLYNNHTFLLNLTHLIFWVVIQFCPLFLQLPTSFFSSCNTFWSLVLRLDLCILVYLAGSCFRGSPKLKGKGSHCRGGVEVCILKKRYVIHQCVCCAVAVASCMPCGVTWGVSRRAVIIASRSKSAPSALYQRVCSDVVLRIGELQGSYMKHVTKICHL